MLAEVRREGADGVGDSHSYVPVTTIHHAIRDSIVIGLIVCRIAWYLVSKLVSFPVDRL